MVRIMTLMDNSVSEQKALTAEHGLSFYVETDNAKLLFDFGAGSHTYQNAKKMNVSMGSIHLAVCSHSHYDHSGGYPNMVEQGLTCPLVTGEHFFEEKYAFQGIKETYLGCCFGEDFLKQHKIEHRICSDILPIADNCYAVGRFRHERVLEQIPKRFVLHDKNGRRPDSFQDEICLVIDTANGLIVIAGCSHPGILNILDTVQAHFDKPVKAVIGGTHLVEADEARIRKTLCEMKEMGIEMLALNHCSGNLVREILKEEHELKNAWLGAGDCLFF